MVEAADWGPLLGRLYHTARSRAQCGGRLPWGGWAGEAGCRSGAGMQASRKRSVRRIVRYLLAVGAGLVAGYLLFGQQTEALSRRGARGASQTPDDSYLVDSASSHMLVSKIKPCMSKYKQLYRETANGSLYKLSFT
jgi:hypothetical protein